MMLASGSDTRCPRTGVRAVDAAKKSTRWVSNADVSAHPRVRRSTAPSRGPMAGNITRCGAPSGVGAASYVAVQHRQPILPPCGRRLVCSCTAFGSGETKGEVLVTIATVQRTSVWVWLPTPAHGQLTAVAATEGVSLPVLARRAAAHAVAAENGRVGMPAPTVEAVEELRAAGYEMNRLLPALGAANTRAQEEAIATRVGVTLERVAAASDKVRVQPSRDGVKAVRLDDVGGVGRERWRLIRVTTDPDNATCWATAAEAAGFRSPANWVRDALAGMHGLAVPRPPAAVTIEARAVAGRVLGLLAQTNTVLAVRPHLGDVLGVRVETAETALWTSLQSLVAQGGQPRARR